MDCELPTEFDVIIIGTGVVESVVSAAASRIGKQVLHIDSNEFYGGNWASFNFETLNKLPDEKLSNINSVNLQDPKIGEGEWVIPTGNDFLNIKDIVREWHIPEKEEKPVEELVSENQPQEIQDAGDAKESVQKLDDEEGVPEEKKPIITQEKLLKDSRKFNIDMAPKLHYARGEFVELMISSNIARYSEFRSVSRVTSWLNGQLELVPCSRSDVFSNEKVSVIEKRMLMKLLTACLDGKEKEFAEYSNKTFKTYLKDRKLTPNLVHYVLYAIAMSDDTTPCMRGVENTQRFLNSLGRFGKTPFLYSMYGSGEIPQAFCRLSAVFGGVYALNQPTGLLLDYDRNFKGILCGKQRINAKHLVLSVEKVPEEFSKNIKATYVSRAVFLTDGSIMNTGGQGEHLTLLLLPPENNKNACTVIEMGTLTGTCPKDTYLVHMFTKQSTNPKDDFKHCVEKIFGNIEEPSADQKKPKVYWSFYFSVPDTSNSDLKTEIPNVYVCPGPDTDLDYDHSIRKAKEIFREIYPDLDFLPRAPDPEEIIIGDENENEGDEPNTQEVQPNPQGDQRNIDGNKSNPTEDSTRNQSDSTEENTCSLTAQSIPVEDQSEKCVEVDGSKENLENKSVCDNSSKSK